MTEKEFISQSVESISSEGIKKFPDDFIQPDECGQLKLPGKALVIGQEFFGAVEILTVDGTPVLQAKDHATAKYIIYANRLKPKFIKIPNEEKKIKTATADYEDYLDSLFKRIEKNYKNEFPV